MKNYIDDYTDDHPIGGCIGVIILILLLVFAGPWVVMHAWNLIVAGMFAGPTMPYWTAFFGTWAIHILFEKTISNTSKN